MANKHPDAPFTYNWPMANIAVDIVLIYVPPSSQEFDPKVLVIRRGKEPFKDKYALPGGFLDVLSDRTLLDAAWRELEEETKIKKKEIKKKVFYGPSQICTLGDIDRDPRGRVISITYLIAVKEMLHAEAADDAKTDSQEWLSLKTLPGADEFAFEHRETILYAARNRLYVNIDSTPENLDENQVVLENADLSQT